jgi:hypothetical protein
VLHQSDQFINKFLPPKKTKPMGLICLWAKPKKTQKKEKLW